MAVSGINFQVFRHGVKCRILDDSDKIGSRKAPVRSEITGFSRHSQKRLSWVYSQGPWKSMITLTYHLDFPEFKESKRHLNTVLQAVRRMGILYLWVVEWQGRGFPHYHIWLSREIATNERLRIAELWLEITGKYNGEKARRFHLHEGIYTVWDVRLNLNYAAKYAQKMAQKWLPVGVEKFGRWWGTSRNLIFPEKDIQIDSCGGKNDVELTDFRRNIRRCINHWSRRRKKNKRNLTNVSFTFVLSDPRKHCILRLYEDMITRLDENYLCDLRKLNLIVDFSAP